MGVPHVFKFFAVYACVPTVRLQEFESISNTFRLMVVDVLLGASFASAVLDKLDEFIDDFSVSEFLTEMGYSIPNASYFFIVLVCAKLGTSMSMELLRVGFLFKMFLYHLVPRSPSQARAYWQPRDPPYMSVVPWILFIFLLLVIYSIVAPLLAPFAWLFFIFAKISWRNQLLFVYQDSRDTKGQLWPYYVEQLVLSVVLSQVFLAGCLLTKGSHKLMAWQLLLAMITGMYYSLQKRFHSSYAVVSMDVAARLDDARGLATPEETANRAEAYLPPELKDDVVEHAIQSASGYGSLNLSSETKGNIIA
mmetsp:Transcript_19032/g.26365  ORF Transcript_19032/g.26365 Transcript_19032/m.26365 type:complete len:307 (+) Transcript_19032:467-1387(+)